MTVRVGKVGVMRMVVCVGIREWPRPSRQHDVTVGPAVRMAMDMPSMPMKDSTRTGHECLTLARHEARRRAGRSRDRHHLGEGCERSYPPNGLVVTTLPNPTPTEANAVWTRCLPHPRHSPPPPEAAPSGLVRPRRSHRGHGGTRREARQHVENGLTERRRSRTDRAWGYHTAQVLKTCWATGPVPLRRAGYRRVLGRSPLVASTRRRSRRRRRRRAARCRPRRPRPPRRSSPSVRD
jgi:hypothetical protein